MQELARSPADAVLLHRRAAVRLRVVSALEMMAGFLLIFALWKVDVHFSLTTLGLASFLVIPGLALALLSLGVQRQHAVCDVLALLITLAQTLVLLVIFGWFIWSALRAVQPVSLTLSVVFLGTPLAVLVWLIHGLWSAGAARRNAHG